MKSCKPIGKLKKKTKFFLYNDTKEYIITKSGHGSGKNVSVEFEYANDPLSPTYSLPKTTYVQIN